MLKEQILIRKVTAIFRATLLKPTPQLIFFPQNAFPLVNIRIQDLLPTLNAKSITDESLSACLSCGSLE